MSFRYTRAGSVEEALALKAQYAEDGLFLAGGQSLMPLINLGLSKPACLIDIHSLRELAAIKSLDGALSLGSLVRYRRMLNESLVGQRWPMITAAIPHIGHAQVLARGTFGGSLAHADPAAELPCVALALEATVVAASAKSEREIAAGDFFRDYYSTALEPDEMLTEVRVPSLPPGAGWSFQEFSHRPGDFALVEVAAVVVLDAQGACREARLTVGAVAPTPIRCPDVERMLIGQRPSDDLWQEAAAAASAAIHPDSDVRASAEYRRHLTRILVRRALRDAVTKAGPP